MSPLSLGLWVAFLSTVIGCSFPAKECPGTTDYLNGLSVDAFAGCTHVRGSITITLDSLEGDPAAGILPVFTSNLTLLSSVEEIDGYLLLWNLNREEFTDLRFLRNLKFVHGLQTYERRQGRYYSLVVEENQYLETLNFASLREVKNGGIRISDNPQLCLVDTISVEDYLFNSSLIRVGGLSMDCTGVACHEECVGTSGCWGTLADECVECRNYEYRSSCVPQCNLSESYANETAQQCIPVWNGDPAATTRGMESSPAHSTPVSTPVPTTTYVRTSVTTLSQLPPPHSTSTSLMGIGFGSITSTLHLTETPESINETALQGGTENTMWIAVVGGVVGGTALIVILLLLCMVSGVYCVKHSKRSSRDKPLQNSWRSPQKYSENSDRVRLLRVTETELPGSPKPPRQRISVSLSSLAQHRGEIEVASDDRLLPSRTPQTCVDSSSPEPKTSGSFSVTHPHPRFSPSPLRHSDTQPSHSPYSTDAPNQRGSRTHSRQTPSHGHRSPSSSTGTRGSFASQRSASGYGMGGVYNTQMSPRRPSQSPSYPWPHSGSGSNRTSGSSWTTTANGSVLFTHGTGRAVASAHGSLSSLPDHTIRQ